MRQFDIASFGDSFIYGSELPNNHNGSLGWPGQAAKNLNCSYNNINKMSFYNDWKKTVTPAAPQVTQLIFITFCLGGNQD